MTPTRERRLLESLRKAMERADKRWGAADREVVRLAGSGSRRLESAKRRCEALRTAYLGVESVYETLYCSVHGE